MRLERSGGGDGRRRVVGYRAKPTHALRTHRSARKDGQHAEYLTAMNERLTAEPSDALGADPLRIRYPLRRGQ